MLKNPKVTRDDVYFGGFNIETGSKRCTLINHYYKNGNEIIIPLPQGQSFKIFINFPTTNLRAQIFEYKGEELIEGVTYREDTYNFPDTKEYYEPVNTEITKYYFEKGKLIGIEVRTINSIEKGYLSIRLG